MVVVNNDAALLPIASQWSQLGCSQIRGYACVQGCEVFKTGTCATQNGAASCD